MGSNYLDRVRAYVAPLTAFASELVSELDLEAMNLHVRKGKRLSDASS